MDNSIIEGVSAFKLEIERLESYCEKLEQRVANGLEMVRCADINFDNFVNPSSVLKSSPFYKIVKMQLAEAEKALAADDEAANAP